MPRLLSAISFVLLLLCVLVGGHLYLAQRLVVEAALSPELDTALQGAIALLGATLVLQPIAERLLRPPYSRWVAWPASLWMGLFFYLLIGVALSDLLFWLGGTSALADTGSRIGSAGRMRAAVVLLGAIAVTVAGLRSGLGQPSLRRVEVALSRWPRALDGFRIVQISDVHIGPILGRRFARRLVDRVNALDADLVAITGDLVDGSVSRLADEVAPFGDLRARHGVFFVTGNHDHYSGARSWVEHARKLGMRVLRNERVRVGSESAYFELAGVDDHHAHLMPGAFREDLDAALRDVSSDAPVVLLAHDPSTFKRAATFGVDLQLSGHTHGGQLWPFGYLVRLVIPFVAGLYRRGPATLYVSRGTGFWGPPMRFFAPAELTELCLRPQPDEGGLA